VVTTHLHDLARPSAFLGPTHQDQPLCPRSAIAHQLVSSSAAIVSYFVLPTALNILSLLWKPLQTVQPWIDLWTSQQPLFMGGNITGEQWSQIATSTVLWVVLPFVSGLVRVLRAEVK
jgi:ABC-2 type transport system permease protein